MKKQLRVKWVSVTAIVLSKKITELRKKQLKIEILHNFKEILKGIFNLFGI